jgi:hypothetical protein
MITRLPKCQVRMIQRRKEYLEKIVHRLPEIFEPGSSNSDEEGGDVISAIRELGVRMKRRSPSEWQDRFVKGLKKTMECGFGESIKIWRRSGRQLWSKF